MIKGYMGDVCFNSKLLKNHIIYIDGNRRIEKIAPFISECEGVILCDNILLVVNEGVEASQENIRTLKDEYNNSEQKEKLLHERSEAEDDRISIKWICAKNPYDSEEYCMWSAAAQISEVV